MAGFEPFIMGERDAVDVFGWTSHGRFDNDGFIMMAL
jgi:hypothetical protein